MEVKQEDLLREIQSCFFSLKDKNNDPINSAQSVENIDIQSAELSEELHPIIKAGWLDKTPPKGRKIYQRRWVQLDPQYLRYFQTTKEVYSKRIVSLGSVEKVGRVGDCKFELHGQSRAFLFRANDTRERDDWVCCLERVLSQRTISGLQSRNVFFSQEDVSFEGHLEVLSPRTTVYTVIGSDKLFLFKSREEYFQGVGITEVDMQMARVKAGESKRCFTLTTLYKEFSFQADSEREMQMWYESIKECVSRSLSGERMCQTLWHVPENRLCADCNGMNPNWASVNLCVLLCEKCAGIHRSLGQSLSKVRSLKLDEHVWTTDLIRVFLLLGNRKANQFWAANVPPSESLSTNSNSDQRFQHISAKYQQRKYCKFHSLFGQQEALNKALCAAVQSDDLLETLSLVNCGADVGCHSGIPEFPSPLALAKRSGQTAQAELLMQNLSSESSESVNKNVLSPSQSGYLFKTGSSTRPIREHKKKEDFARRWCSLSDQMFKYYKNEQSSHKSGGMKTSDIICLSVNSAGKHSIQHSFELFSEEGKVYLFGSDDVSVVQSWIRTIAMAMLPPVLLESSGACERVGRLRCSESSRGLGWFCLSGFKLHVLLEEVVRTIDLRKLLSLDLSDGQGSVVLVWRGGRLHLLADRRPHFPGWLTSIQQNSGAGDQTLSLQQLTELSVPVIVSRCLDYVTQYGLLSEGIYRKSGVRSQTSKLLERFRQDARSVTWSECDFSVDDVACTLKRFLREVKDGVFNGQENCERWLTAAGLQDRSERIRGYRILLSNLPDVNRETLKVLMHHLLCVQHMSDINEMTIQNLSIVFSPTLLLTDKAEDQASRVVQELMQNYCSVFDISESDLERQLNMTSVVLHKHNSQSHMIRTASSTVCAVYLENRDAEVLIQVKSEMTADMLVSAALKLRGIERSPEDFWSCFEVLEKEESERLLHDQERVLPLYFSLTLHNHLLIKKCPPDMISVMTDMESQKRLSKSGTLLACEVKGDGARSFSSRFCEISEDTFTIHREGSLKEQQWPVKQMKLYHGFRSQLYPPAMWGLTLMHEKQQWYLCCLKKDDWVEWTATIFSIKYDGNFWTLPVK